MAGFLVRRSQAARELQAHDAELAKRAASALLAADEGIRIASDEIGFAEAQLDDEPIEAARAVLAMVRRDLSDAFRLNRLNHDAMPGTPDEVRARYVLILRLCEWAEHVLGALTSTLADRVATARLPSVDLGEIRADAVIFPLAVSPRFPVVAEVEAGPDAHLIRTREARVALDAATAGAIEGAARVTPSMPRVELRRAIARADRALAAARAAITDHGGRIGAEARTRLAEAERIRRDLRYCLGGLESAEIEPHEGHGARAMRMTLSVASLAEEAVHLARRDLDGARGQVVRTW